MPLLGFVYMSYLMCWGGSFWYICPACILGVLQSLPWWDQSHTPHQGALETGSLPVWMRGPPAVTTLAMHAGSLRRGPSLLHDVFIQPQRHNTLQHIVPQAFPTLAAPTGSVTTPREALRMCKDRIHMLATS